jgi:copper(I)-binding protein
VLVTASCAAGEHAQTAAIQAAVDAASGRVGGMALSGAALHAPSGSSYPAGSNVSLAITLVNTKNSADTLVNVTSSAFTGWGVVDNAQAASTTASGSADTGLTIEANSAQRLGLAGTGASATASPRTLVLMNLAGNSAPLFPGSAVDITFRFADAGSTTLRVPVQLTATPPNGVTLPAPTGSPAG